MARPRLKTKQELADANRQTIPLLKHQLAFVQDSETRYLGLVGGYGCGKTKAFCYKALHMASLNVGHRGVLLEPTNAMVQDVLIPELDQILEELGLKYTFRASPYPKYTIHFGNGTTELLLRSAENYQRLVGLNLAFFGVDEIDTINKRIAMPMWRVLVSRLRAGKVYQGFTTSTPEGFNFLYQYFVEEAEGKTDRRIIKARTQDNPFLPEEYIDSLLANYPPNLIKAYLEGEFINLNSGTVYHNFNRELNGTTKTLADFLPNATLHIGQDFNVGKCSSVVHVVYKDIVYAVDEIQGAKNTEDVIRQIKMRFPNRAVWIYPDASGNSEKTNASHTDIFLLKQAGFEVRNPSKNPMVRDRVGSMNAMFLNGLGQRRYFVNTNKCKLYTRSLEQQAFDSSGAPDKSNDLDHPVDAAGYFIHYNWPIRGQAKIHQA